MSGLTKITWHWSAGSYTPGASEEEHYHFFVDGDGVVHAGEHTPEDNISTSDNSYAAHVSQFNTGNIGIAVCAMAGAIDSPFSAGKYPMKEIQITAMLKKTAELCKKYNIVPSPTTTFSHAEVQQTFGVTQSGKWDITWLPGMLSIANAIVVGDMLRGQLSEYMSSTPPTPSNNLEARVAALEAWAKSFQ